MSLKYINYKLHYLLCTFKKGGYLEKNVYVHFVDNGKTFFRE